jgi:flagellar biosynthesis GTPase FlhF
MHLFVNDVTFKRQQEALTLLPKIPKIDEKLRIDDFTWDRIKGEIGRKGGRSLKKIENLGKLPENLEFFNKGLNEYQIDFVKKSLVFKYFLLLHGPFGTGKTTTLVESILQNYKV